MRRRSLAALAAGALVIAAAAPLSGCGGSGAAATASGPGAAAPATTTAAHRHGRMHGLMPATGSYRGRVPILMYHVVNDPTGPTRYPQLWVSWKTFVATMLALRRAGFAAVTEGQVWAAWHGGPGLPKRPIVVSFDDGYLSHSTHARPTLRALGWPGVLNLEGKNIDPKVGLSRHQVRGLIHDGWEIDAHTLTHPDLTTVPDAQLTREVAGSREKIQRLFGVPVDFFAYPSGRFDARVQAAVRAAGFKAATTTQPGIASPQDDPYAWPRIRVNRTDTPATVVARALGRASAAAGAGGG